MIIEHSITRRKKALKRACRFLNGIVGLWISGSIPDLFQFHELIFNSTISDNDLEAILSRFEPLKIKKIMDSVKTNLTRWVTSEKIGKTILGVSSIKSYIRLRVACSIMSLHTKPHSM